MHHVVGGDAVGGDQQQTILADGVDVADLALCEQVEMVERGGFAHLGNATNRPRLPAGCTGSPPGVLPGHAERS